MAWCRTCRNSRRPGAAKPDSRWSAKTSAEFGELLREQVPLAHNFMQLLDRLLSLHCSSWGHRLTLAGVALILPTLPLSAQRIDGRVEAKILRTLAAAGEHSLRWQWSSTRLGSKEQT